MDVSLDFDTYNTFGISGGSFQRLIALRAFYSEFYFYYRGSMETSCRGDAVIVWDEQICWNHFDVTHVLFSMVAKVFKG